MFSLAAVTRFSLLHFFFSKCLISVDFADSKKKKKKKVTASALPVGTSTRSNKRPRGERGDHMTVTHSVSGPGCAQAGRSAIPSCLAANCQAVNGLLCVYLCRGSV